MADELNQQKRALRSELRARRQQLTSTQKQQNRDGLTEQLISLVHRYSAKKVACYLSAPTEPDTRGFLNWAHETGIEVLLPISREDGLLDWAMGDGHSETTGVLGVPEVVGEILSPIAINEVDIIIVPAAAVSETGVRLGWGRGYFDRTLGSMQQCPPVYAVVFTDEILSEIPQEIHDAPLNGAVTPSGIVDFDNQN